MTNSDPSFRSNPCSCPHCGEPVEDDGTASSLEEVETNLYATLGAPGVGKSALVMQIAREQGAPFVDFGGDGERRDSDCAFERLARTLSQHSPEDYAGFPWREQTPAGPEEDE